MLVTWAYYRNKRDEIQKIYPPKRLIVRIDGKVVKPGVYEMPESSRVKDIIEQAGGLLDEKDSVNLNWDSQISDGQIIHIGNRK
jgi:competence protein ComEA